MRTFRKIIKCARESWGSDGQSWDLHKGSLAHSSCQHPTDSPPAPCRPPCVVAVTTCYVATGIVLKPVCCISFPKGHEAAYNRKD